MGALMKCDAVYETPFWREDGLSGTGLNTEGAVRTSLRQLARRTPRSACCSPSSAAPPGRPTAPWPRAKRRKAVLEGFAAIVGDKALDPIEYTEHDWTPERWTRAARWRSRCPARSRSTAQVIREPFGRVHWAGTETSTYWPGYMDGAVRAGERAAIEVADRL